MKKKIFKEFVTIHSYEQMGEIEAYIDVLEYCKQNGVSYKSAVDGLLSSAYYNELKYAGFIYHKRLYVTDLQFKLAIIFFDKPKEVLKKVIKDD